MVNGETIHAYNEFIMKKSKWLNLGNKRKKSKIEHALKGDLRYKYNGDFNEKYNRKLNYESCKILSFA